MTSKAIARERRIRFAEAMAKAMDGDPLSTLEKVLLFDVSEALLRGEDARPLVGTQKPANRPVDEQKARMAYWWTLDVARMVAEGQLVREAKEAAEKRWRVSEEQMRRAWLEHGSTARETVEILGADRAAKKIERHRKSARTKG